MERCLDAYYTKADTMELAYEHLIIVDPDNTERWEREVNDVHTLREAMKDKWLPIIARATSPAAQPLRREGHENHGKIKIRADLKPRELSEDSSPVEFATWCEEYTIYHSASNLQLASKREQQINLYSHIDEALRQRLKAEICHETPVMEQPGELPALRALRQHSSCIAALAELFRRNNPIFKRRQDLMNMTPSKGEKFTAYMRRVRAHSLECALHEMKNTDLITQIVLMHCPVEEIRKDAKKEKDLDWQKMTAWLVGYTKLQHTGHDVPHYDANDWTFVRGAFCSIDRPYGRLIDLLHHRIGSTHVAHHLSSRIPHYRALEATNAVAAAFPQQYRYDPTPVLLALWRESKLCVAVVKTVDGWRYRSS